MSKIKSFKKDFQAVIGFVGDWGKPYKLYFWLIKDSAHKIHIEPCRDFDNKRIAWADLKRWIARLHIDCEIIDETEGAK